MARFRVALTGLAAAALVLASCGVTSALGSSRASASPLTVLSVARENSSVVVAYSAVDGAKDYRVYDRSAPGIVKYAGLVHVEAPDGRHFVTDAAGTVQFPLKTSHAGSGPTTYDGPAPSIQWNRMEDERPHTLIVQAVNELGPVPMMNLYNPDTDAPLHPAAGMAGMGGNDLGMNRGETGDGLISTNGQGPSTNTPQVIAQSEPFRTQANPHYASIPSSTSATQTYFDPFPDTEGKTITRTRDEQNCDERMTYSMNRGTPLAATLQYAGADTKHSMPFVAEGHFMDTLFDGPTPGCNTALHQSHGSLSFSPRRTVNPSGGKVIHLTMEVDSHFSARRWVAFNLAPTTDPLTGWVPEVSSVSKSNDSVFLQFAHDGCTLDIYNGTDSSGMPKGTAGGTYGSSLWGAGGQAKKLCSLAWGHLRWQQFGLALDHRTRFDFFISQTHAALFVGGVLMIQSAIPASSFEWFNQPLKVYYTHYVYHTDNDIAELEDYACYPLNAFWFNDPQQGSNCSGQTFPSGYGFPHSDERHWDNFGFEVLPPRTGGHWSAYGRLVQPPRSVRPGGAGRPSPRDTAVPARTSPPERPARSCMTSALLRTMFGTCNFI